MACTKPNGNAAEKPSANLGFKADFGPERADTICFLRLPVPPIHCRPHPNGSIYFSGRFWKADAKSQAKN